MTLAEQIKQVMGKYEAMVAEGEMLAKKRQGIIGDYEFDTSKYIELTDWRPAYTAWKATQSDMVDIIRQLTDIVKQQHEAIAETQAARKATREHGKDATHRLRASAARKRIKALVVSAPIVKGVE